jgi:hypothetical protein
MKHNFQSIINRKSNSVQYIYEETVLQMALRENSEGIYVHASQGGLSGLCSLRSDSQTGERSRVQWPKAT